MASGAGRINRRVGAEERLGPSPLLPPLRVPLPSASSPAVLETEPSPPPEADEPDEPSPSAPSVAPSTGTGTSAGTSVADATTTRGPAPPAAPPASTTGMAGFAADAVSLEGLVLALPVPPPSWPSASSSLSLLPSLLPPTSLLPLRALLLLRGRPAVGDD